MAQEYERERRRKPPVTKTFVGAVGASVAATVVGAVLLGAVSGSRSYGQMEERVQTHDTTLKKHGQLIDRLEERDRAQQTKLNDELTAIRQEASEKTAILSGIAATLEAIQAEQERQGNQLNARDRTFRK